MAINNTGISSKSKTPLKRILAGLNSIGLPGSYVETKIALLPRDPYWAFAYWELAAKTL